MGVRKITDFLEKATWTLAGAMVVLSIASSFFVKPHVQAKQSESFIEQSQQRDVYKRQPLVAQSTQDYYRETVSVAVRLAARSVPCPPERR